MIFLHHSAVKNTCFDLFPLSVSNSETDGWIFMLIAHGNAPFVLAVAAGVIDNLTATEIYSLGRWIVETQQMGQKRAKYGSRVIKILSEKLQEEFGKGFSEDTLKNARKFYLTYKERISETVFSLFEKELPFIVSWSHYLQLIDY